MNLTIDFSDLDWDVLDDATPVHATVHEVPTIDARVEALPSGWRDAVEAVRALPRARSGS